MDNIAKQIRLLTPDDITTGMRLGQQNGWNQLDADWQRFLTMQPDGCFVAEIDGEVVGTVCACIFDNVAWIALMLVDAAHRKRGIGTALMRHVLGFLDAQSVPSIRLDATPLGRPIYEKLGFGAEYELVRYAGVLPAAPAVGGIKTASSVDLELICTLDESATRTNRRKFLQQVFAEYPDAMRIARREGELLGYACSRPGARAVQIGPCIAHEETGPLLLADTFNRHAGQNVYIDIPVSHSQAKALAEEKGLTVQRHLLRMYRGQRVAEDVEKLWASSGPEKG